MGSPNRTLDKSGDDRRHALVKRTGPFVLAAVRGQVRQMHVKIPAVA